MFRTGHSKPEDLNLKNSEIPIVKSEMFVKKIIWNLCKKWYEDAMFFIKITGKLKSHVVLF